MYMHLVDAKPIPAVGSFPLYFTIAVYLCKSHPNLAGVVRAEPQARLSNYIAIQ